MMYHLILLLSGTSLKNKNMSIITNLTRTWLTRSFYPFMFKNEYDQLLVYENINELGLYIHIPFCNSICDFCPYCKVLYEKNKCNRYIDALIKEIHIVGRQINNKKRVTSLYFGGGTPALITCRLQEIIDTVKEYFIITEGIGIELHPENVNVSKLTALKSAGVTKISIGVQSFNNKYQNVLGRKSFNILNLEAALSKVHFDTVSMDFIFALPNQTFEDLKSDIDIAFDIGANHIAIYPFIDFSFTSSNINRMPKKQKQKLLEDITEYCTLKGYIRKSIWCFSNDINANFSSMTRNNFLGFGCSATTLLKDQFKINTFSVDEYCNRIQSLELPTSLTLRFTKRQRMIYYLFWNAYTMTINEKDFYNFFDVSLKSMYGLELNVAKLLGFIREDNGVYNMTNKGAFYYHYYEYYFTLSYIDKMWNIMQKEPFPDKIIL